MLNFCTLFDINFISQGLVMYESLKKHCKDDFMLYIFAFCDESYKLLNELNLAHVKVVSLAELEDGIPALKDVKKNRTKGEYCWTCGSASILYCIKTFNLEQCTYLDADIHFYSNPRVLLDEMGDKSVLITEHRYTPCYDQTETSGRYCVQFISFKNDENGMKVLNWWVDSCIEWCYARCENGKFGDQKYLDDWTERFEGVHVLENIGGGVAPWNVQQYKLIEINNQIYINDLFPLIFYHFHNIKITKNGYISSQKFRDYEIDKIVEDIIYKPYIEELFSKNAFLNKKNKNVKVMKNKFDDCTISVRLKNIRKNLLRVRFGKNGYLKILGKKII